jgi:hypothetical protein
MKPPKGSSPKIQQDLYLNNDATWHTKKREEEKLRDDKLLAAGRQEL